MEAGGVGEEKGAPGCPRVQLKVIVASPPLVVRFRELLPPELQTIMNSFTEAPRNWELDLANMVTFEESSLRDIQLSG